MKVLLVKMSSMGDILHTFPALSDLQRARPDIHLHWVVEKPFVELAGWHPGAERIIPIEQRRWLRQRNRASWQAFRQWRRELRKTAYDAVIDSQALTKSALIARQARRSGPLHGFHPRDIREKPAGWLVTNRHRVDPDQHAINRQRALFAAAFGYTHEGAPDFGIRDTVRAIASPPAQPRVMLIPGTTWANKHWHLPHWITLASELIAQGEAVEIVWGSPGEQAMARQIREQCPEVVVPDERLTIPQVAGRLAHARAAVGMDTGFSHIAGAVGTPTIALYGPTAPGHYGLLGAHTGNESLALDCQPCHQRQCKWLPKGSTQAPPCMRELTPERILAQLNRLL